jgi:hypothetical protein
MFVLKYIAAIIALFCTLMFISSLITSISAIRSFSEQGEENKMAGIRIILAGVMAITWPLVFLL